MICTFAITVLGPRLRVFTITEIPKPLSKISQVMTCEMPFVLSS